MNENIADAQPYDVRCREMIRWAGFEIAIKRTLSKLSRGKNPTRKVIGVIEYYWEIYGAMEVIE